MVVAKIVTPDNTVIEFPTEAVAETYLSLLTKTSNNPQSFEVTATDPGTYEFYLVAGFEGATRGEMFSDHLLYESMNTYDTYNKLTLVVRDENPCVDGWNY